MEEGSHYSATRDGHVAARSLVGTGDRGRADPSRDDAESSTDEGSVSLSAEGDSAPSSPAYLCQWELPTMAEVATDRTDTVVPPQDMGRYATPEGSPRKPPRNNVNGGLTSPPFRTSDAVTETKDETEFSMGKIVSYDVESPSTDGSTTSSYETESDDDAYEDFGNTIRKAISRAIGPVRMDLPPPPPPPPLLYKAVVRCPAEACGSPASGAQDALNEMVNTVVLESEANDAALQLVAMSGDPTEGAEGEEKTELKRKWDQDESEEDASVGEGIEEFFAGDLPWAVRPFSQSIKEESDEQTESSENHNPQIITARRSRPSVPAYVEGSVRMYKKYAASYRVDEKNSYLLWKRLLYKRPNADALTCWKQRFSNRAFKSNQPWETQRRCKAIYREEALATDTMDYNSRKMSTLQEIPPSRPKKVVSLYLDDDPYQSSALASVDDPQQICYPVASSGTLYSRNDRIKHDSATPVRNQPPKDTNDVIKQKANEVVLSDSGDETDKKLPVKDDNNASVQQQQQMGFVHVSAENGETWEQVQQQAYVLTARENEGDTAALQGRLVYVDGNVVHLQGEPYVDYSTLYPVDHEQDYEPIDEDGDEEEEEEGGEKYEEDGEEQYDEKYADGKYYDEEDEEEEEVSSEGSEYESTNRKGRGAGANDEIEILSSDESNDCVPKRSEPPKINRESSQGTTDSVKQSPQVASPPRLLQIQGVRSLAPSAETTARKSEPMDTLASRKRRFVGPKSVRMRMMERDEDDSEDEDEEEDEEDRVEEAPPRKRLQEDSAPSEYYYPEPPRLPPPPLQTVFAGSRGLPQPVSVPPVVIAPPPPPVPPAPPIVRSVPPAPPIVRSVPPAPPVHPVPSVYSAPPPLASHYPTVSIPGAPPSRVHVQPPVFTDERISATQAAMRLHKTRMEITRIEKGIRTARNNLHRITDQQIYSSTSRFRGQVEELHRTQISQIRDLEHLLHVRKAAFAREEEELQPELEHWERNALSPPRHYEPLLHEHECNSDDLLFNLQRRHSIYPHESESSVTSRQYPSAIHLPSKQRL